VSLKEHVEGVMSNDHAGAQEEKRLCPCSASTAWFIVRNREITARELRELVL